jgi:hypothetical protein
VFQFIKEGVFDERSFLDEFNIFLNEIDNPQKMYLGNFLVMSDEEFNETRKYYLDAIDNGEITNTASLMNVFARMRYQAGIGLLGMTEDAFYGFFRDSVTKARDAGTLVFSNLEGQIDSLIYGEQVENKYNILMKDYLLAIDAQLQHQHLSEIVNGFVASIHEDIDTFIRDFSRGTITPIFPYVDNKLLVRNLRSSDNETVKKFIIFIKGRYKEPHLLGHFVEDLEGLMRFRDSLIAVDCSGDLLSNYLWRQLIENVSETINNLEKHAA